jgi:hypothetical protein
MEVGVELSLMEMQFPQFIEVGGCVINPAQISFIEFRPNVAMIHVGRDAITVHGDEAQALRRFFQPIRHQPIRHHEAASPDPLREFYTELNKLRGDPPPPAEEKEAQ